MPTALSLATLTDRRDVGHDLGRPEPAAQSGFAEADVVRDQPR